MPVAWRFAAALAAVSLPIAASVVRQGPVQLPFSSQVEVRRATPADAEIFVSVIIAAFEEAAEWKYVHQFQDQYPNDTYNCAVPVLRDMLSFTGNMAHLGVVPSDEPPHEKTAVSVSMWALPKSLRHGIFDFNMVTGLSLLGNYGLLGYNCKQRDINETRARDLGEQFDQNVQRVLDRLYRPRQQLLLSLLGTLPAYQGRDIAGHLLRKGLTAPDDTPDSELPKALYATLAATTAGEPLYMENGFESIKNVTLHFLDGLGSAHSDIMAKQLRP